MLGAMARDKLKAKSTCCVGCSGRWECLERPVSVMPRERGATALREDRKARSNAFCECDCTD
eukprot:833802-Rhodomonas_salina.3